MAEAPKAAVPAKKITRKKAGFRKVMVTLTEDQAKRLDELATADDRGSATNMLSVLVKRNFAMLIGSVSPALQMSLPSGEEVQKGGE